MNDGTKLPTAAALIIGNEILTGKVTDENTVYLAKSLFDIGYQLRRVIVCPDEIETIATNLNDLRAAHDVMFTSGGVGPTHDDVTIAGVAKAFDKPVIRSPAVAQLIRHYYGDKTTEGHLRMADLPAGAELIRSAKLPWPTICIENVYVMPGVPKIFRLKFQELAPRLDQGLQLYSYAVHTACDEGSVAMLLGKLHEEHADVMVGSYPQWEPGQIKLKLTFDGCDKSTVESAAKAFIDALEPTLILEHKWAGS